MIKTTLSSNVSHKISIELKSSILKYVDVFKVSVSGITKDVYKKYHRGGNIQTVLKNISEFVMLRDELNTKTKIVWVFGRNLYNINDRYYSPPNSV